MANPVQNYKRILIIKSKTTAFSVVEMYLQNRDWQVFSTTNIKNGLELLINYRPQFVLISIDHPNKKIQFLPKMIAMKFPVCAIACAEHPHVSSTQKLSASAVEYLIYPPTTGPAIERTAFKYFKELQLKEKRNSNGPIPNDDEAFTVENISWISQQILNEPMVDLEPIPLSSDVLQEGIKKSLDDLTLNNSPKFIAKVSIATKVACIMIRSAHFSGYIVAAMAQDQALNENWLNQLRSKIYKYLLDQGEKLEDENVLQLTIQPVEFNSWAIQYADFLRKTIHQGNELALAYFPCDAQDLKTPEVQKDQMLPLRLMDLPGDIAVDFNLYLHMPANEKYILYTPKGSTFLLKQKLKLQSQGIKTMHMHKDEVAGLDKYKAQNYLNSSIEEHKQKTQKKAI
ncbi:MAG: hypothetical protein ACOYOK_14470 [Pseudobdellovibrionaceae bacterium]